MSFNIITAIFKNGGMGKRGELPWDLVGPYSRYFSKLTIGNQNNAVIMGSSTYDDIVCYKYSPLTYRQNLVMSTNTEMTSTYPIVEYFNNIDNVKSHCNQANYDDIWIIGGTKTYREFLLDKSIKNIYCYHIDTDHDSDMYFPIKMNNDDGKVLFSYKEEGIEHSFVHHKIM